MKKNLLTAMMLMAAAIGMQAQPLRRTLILK